MNTNVNNSATEPLTLGHILELARAHAGREMAAIKLGKPPASITLDEIVDALENPETPGDEVLSGRTLRGGESAYLWAMKEYGCYDEIFASRRLTTNRDLDLGEVTVMSEPTPTPKRQVGRPSRSLDMACWLAMNVIYRHAAGDAPSIEKVVEMLTGRDRKGDAIAGIVPVVVLPRGRKSHFTVHAMLRAAAKEAPSLLEEAREQGAILRAGGQPDGGFVQRLMQTRAILANPDAMARMLRAFKRQN